jgi:PAS domain-containing protein
MHHSMTNPFTRRRSQPSLTQVDDLFERLKKHDPEWLAATLNERWNQISDSHKHDTHDTVAAPERRPVLGRHKRRSQHSIEPLKKSVWPYDVTQATLPDGKVVSEHTRLLRSHDWASTKLGAMDQWSEELRRNVNMCMADPRPAATWWTEDRICIYNEQYSLILGKRHPAVFGRSFVHAWPELHANFSPHFDEVMQSGHAASGDDALYMIERNGYCEEFWASWGIIPVQAGDGDTGFYNAVFETTRQVVSERRMSTLMLLGRCTSAAIDTQDFWKQVVRGLDPNHYDIPFLAIYAVAVTEQTMNRSSKLSDQWEAASQTSKTPSERSGTSSDRQWTLEGMLGLPTNCSGLPSRLDAESGATLTPNFNDIVAKGKITLLTTEDGTFPKGLQGVAKSRAFGDDCTAAVLCPVGPTNRENVLGFMLIGINPRHAYDDDYKSFIKILSRQMGTSIASVVLAEEEIKRAKIAAELATQDRIRLSQQLAVTKQEAKDTEVRFRRMTELSPMAMFHFDELGNVLWANERWFDLTQHPRDAFHPLSWYNVIHEDDISLMGYELCCANQRITLTYSQYV